MLLDDDGRPWYGVDYTMELSYDHNMLDIMNSVNNVLFDAGVEYQFVVEEHEQDDNIPSIFYSFVRSDKLIKE